MSYIYCLVLSSIFSVIQGVAPASNSLSYTIAIFSLLIIAFTVAISALQESYIFKTLEICVQSLMNTLRDFGVLHEVFSKTISGEREKFDGLLSELSSIVKPDAELIHRSRVLKAGKELCDNVRGNMYWINVPLTRLVDVWAPSNKILQENDKADLFVGFQNWLEPALLSTNCRSIYFIIDLDNETIKSRMEVLKGIIRFRMGLLGKTSQQISDIDNKIKWWNISHLARYESMSDSYKLADVGPGKYEVHKFTKGALYMDKGSYEYIEGSITRRLEDALGALNSGIAKYFNDIRKETFELAYRKEDFDVPSQVIAFYQGANMGKHVFDEYVREHPDFNE